MSKNLMKAFVFSTMIFCGFAGMGGVKAEQQLFWEIDPSEGDYPNCGDMTYDQCESCCKQHYNDHWSCTMNCT